MHLAAHSGHRRKRPTKLDSSRQRLDIKVSAELKKKLETYRLYLRKETGKKLSLRSVVEAILEQFVEKNPIAP